MEWGEDALEAPEKVQKFNALLWATSRRRWSASSGARSWAASPETAPPEKEWELVAVEIDGEEFPIESGGGEVARRSLDESAAGLDPPPDRGPPAV